MRKFKERLNKSSYVLLLTALTAALLYSVFLFGGMIGGIINSNIISSADARVLKSLTIARDSWLTEFFLWVTLLGAIKIIAIFVIITILIFWIWKKQNYIFALLLSIAGAEFFTLVSKDFIKRPRPADPVYLENSFSFPSGHATIAIAFYGFIAYVLIRESRQLKTKISVFFAGLAIIILVGFSRLYLGVHYTSDICGGYLVGAIWLIIGIIISQYFTYKNKYV